MMLDRLCKIVLIAAIAFFFSLVIIDNLTDYSTNFAFVQHVLSMDTIFPSSNLHWRAITNPKIHHAFFWSIIAWEFLTMGLCWTGVIRLLIALSADAKTFHQAKQLSILALTSSCLLWLAAFLCVGGEWFAMWQSPIWNGQPIASRMFIISSAVLVTLRQPEVD